MSDQREEILNDDILDEAEPGADDAPLLFGEGSEVLTQSSRCPDCASHLHYTHFSDFIKNQTEEVSRCPECTFKGKRFLYRLH